MSITCGCMDMCLIFLKLILLTRFSQQGILVGGESQRGDHMTRGCSRLISISRRWGWPMHLPEGDGQTEAPGVPAENGCSDALLWRMLPYLT